MYGIVMRKFISRGYFVLVCAGGTTALRPTLSRTNLQHVVVSGFVWVRQQRYEQQFIKLYESPIPRFYVKKSDQWRSVFFARVRILKSIMERRLQFFSASYVFISAENITLLKNNY